VNVAVVVDSRKDEIADVVVVGVVAVDVVVAGVVVEWRWWRIVQNQVVRTIQRPVLAVTLVTTIGGGAYSFYFWKYWWLFLVVVLSVNSFFLLLCSQSLHALAMHHPPQLKI
jgi:CBS-domain-containing membrane protein